MGYVSLTKLSLLIQDKLNKLNAGNLSTSELDELKDLATELSERIIVLQYKAHESQLLQNVNSVLNEEATQIHIKQPVSNDQPIKFNLGGNTNPTPKVEPKIEVKPEVKQPVAEQIAMPIMVEPVVQTKPVVTEQKTIHTDKPAQKIEEPKTNVVSGKLTLAERMQKTKVDNLATAIGLNQKFLFMNFLFQGENTSYNDAIEKLNNMPTAADARHYIRELAYIYTWDYENENVVLFTEYVERRYM
jgi:hypothetical protein